MDDDAVIIPVVLTDKDVDTPVAVVAVVAVVALSALPVTFPVNAPLNPSVQVTTPAVTLIPSLKPAESQGFLPAKLLALITDIRDLQF